MRIDSPGSTPSLFLSLLLSGLLTLAADSPPPEHPVAPGVQRERVNLILIDVVVTDRKGRPVNDLRPGEFSLRVDGQPHEINSVELRQAAKEAPGTGSLSAPPEERAPGEVPAYAVRSPRRFVFFLDGLNSERGLGERPIQVVRTFLKESLLPEDEAMIVGLGRELKIYQEFTSDPAALAKAVEVLEADPAVRLAGENTALANMRRMQEAEDLCVKCDAPARREAAQRLAVVFADEDRRRTRRTLASLRAIITSLKAAPGRKELFLLTEGFCSDPDALYGSPGDPRSKGYAETPSPGNPDGGAYLSDLPAAGTSLESEILRIAREAGSAQVAIHTVNTQGMPHGTAMMLHGVSGRSAGEIIESSASNTLAGLALGTGGVATRGTNDFLPALQRVEREARATYVVSYVPSGDPDGLFHSTRVEVHRKGVRVRASEGFIYLTQSEIQERELFSAYMAPELYHDIPLALEAIAYLPEGGAPAVEFALAVPDQVILFLPGTGGFTARLEAGVALLLGKSRIADRFTRSVETRLTPQEMAAGGMLTLLARRQVPPGDYEAVAVVRDLGTGNIGALRQRVKVPDLARDRIAMSSLFLEAPGAKGRRVDLEPETAGNAEIVTPAAFRVFPRGAEIRASCFIYHPARKGGTGNAEFQVRGILRKGEMTVKEFPPAVHIFTPEQDVAAIPLKIPIPLSGLEPGTYSLQVQVLDQIGGQGVVQSLDFMVR